MRAPPWMRVASLLCFVSRPGTCLTTGLHSWKNRVISFRSGALIGAGLQQRDPPRLPPFVGGSSRPSSSVRWWLKSSRRPPPSLHPASDSRSSPSRHRPRRRRRLVSWLLSAWEGNSDDTSSSSATNSSASPREEAGRLRERALRLREEARALEVELERTKLAGASRRQHTKDDLMHQLFPANATAVPTARSVAQVLRDGRWSVDQAVVVLEALYQRRKKAAAIRMDTNSSFDEAMAMAHNTSSQPVRVAFHDEADLNFTVACVDALLGAAALLDEEVPLRQQNAHGRWPDGRAAATLKSRWNEWSRSDDKERERQLNVAFGGGSSTGRATGDDATRRAQGDGSASTPATPPNRPNRGPKVLDWALVKEAIGVFPPWVPSSLVPYVAAARSAVTADDVRLIKEKVLTQTTFFCTSTETTPSAAIFRGNLRGPDNASTRNVTAVAWKDLQQRMEKEGVSDRVQLFFLSDPEWKVGKDPREPVPRPVVLALSKLVRPDDSLMEQGVLKTVLKRFSYFMALTTGFVYAVRCMSLNEWFFDSVMTMKSAASLQSCVPIMAGLLGVQAVHELAHLLVARHNGIRTGFPVPLPAFSIGLFGCITPLRSFPATRTALFDFAMSGPISALLLSVGLMGFGVLHTVRASRVALSRFPFVPASLLKSSFLSGSILSFLAPKVMMMPMSQPIPISPWFMVGFAGSIAAALNLLPIYRLDGGRACAAAMGQRFAAVASTSSLLFLLSISFNPDSYGMAFWWAMAVVLFQRKPDIPARNDVTEIDEYRVGAWLTSLAASILTLAPFPGANGIL